eukprot:7362862-Alexandrium_andersonii.AAC.1
MRLAWRNSVAMRSRTMRMSTRTGRRRWTPASARKPPCARACSARQGSWCRSECTTLLGHQERVVVGALVTQAVREHPRTPVRAGRAGLGPRHKRIQIQPPGHPNIEAALALGREAEAERL